MQCNAMQWAKCRYQTEESVSVSVSSQPLADQRTKLRCPNRILRVWIFYFQFGQIIGQPYPPGYVWWLLAMKMKCTHAHNGLLVAQTMRTCNLSEMYYFCFHSIFGGRYVGYTLLFCSHPTDPFIQQWDSCSFYPSNKEKSNPTVI